MACKIWKIARQISTKEKFHVIDIGDLEPKLTMKVFTTFLLHLRIKWSQLYNNTFVSITHSLRFYCDSQAKMIKTSNRHNSCHQCFL